MRLRLRLSVNAAQTTLNLSVSSLGHADSGVITASAFQKACRLHS